MYIKEHVETVDTKDHSSAIVYWVWYSILSVNTFDMKIKACNALNAVFVKTVKTHPHIPAHYFLNIQLIFNPQKVLESWDWGLFNHTTNTIYVDTVDTRQGSLMHSMLSMSKLSIKKHIHTFLPITFLIFNQFQSAKSFGKLRLRAFQPYHQYYICRYCWYKTKISNAFNAIYVDTVNKKHIHTFLPITFLIFNQFSICKKFWKLRLRAFQPYHQYYICWYCQYKTRVFNAFNAIYVDTVNAVFTPHYSVYSVV